MLEHLWPPGWRLSRVCVARIVHDQTSTLRVINPIIDSEENACGLAMIYLTCFVVKKV